MNSNVIQDKVLEVTKTIEKQIDAAIEKIDNMDLNDLEQLRKQRLQELKSHQNRKHAWLQSGHGSYDQLAEEKMFFDIVKKSDNVIVHFFTPTNTRSPILDKHLKILAPKHLETKFVSLNAEKCPFLAERLHVKTIPTLVCIQNSIMIDKVVGFTSLGNRDDFTTEVLEWRLAQNQVIKYDGDLSVPPTHKEPKDTNNPKRSIRDGVFNNDSDDDLEIEDCSAQFKKDACSKDQTYLTPEEELELGISNENN